MAADGIRVRGICPVVETPFTDDGEVDLDSFTALVDHLLGAGVQGLMFPGFASEFYKLTDDERDALTDRLLDRARRSADAVVVISVPDHSTPIARERARRAVRYGAHLVNVLPPHLFNPSGAAVREHIETVLAAVDPTPAIVQYAPAETGTALDAAGLAAMAAAARNLVQVKVESTPPGRLISDLAAQDPPLGSIVGYGGVQLIDALRRGAEAAQPGCSFAEIYVRIWDLWQSDARQEAVALHMRLLPYISYWMQGIELIIRAEKRISALRGLIASEHCRAPARELDREELAMIDRFLDDFAELLP